MEVIKEDGQVVPIEDAIDPYRRIDPRVFKEKDLPLIVLVDDLRSFSGWAIKAHTHGNYNHAFIMHKPGKLVSQNFTGFRESDIEAYIQPGIILKFWQIKNMSQLEKDQVYAAIDKRLKLPPWRRAYDFVGTFLGQFLHLKWLQSPFQEFCSEQVNDDGIKPVARTAIMHITEPSPSELNDVFNIYIEVMRCIGYWWID